MIPVEVLSSLQALFPSVIPLGAVGLFRWSVWGVKRLVGVLYRSTDMNGYAATVSVVMPVYDEDPDVFRQSLASIAANRPQELIAVIDARDTRCLDVFRSLEAQYPFVRLLVTEREGKRHAIADGYRASRGEIIVLVDSDTVWPCGVLQPLLAPFLDPRVGGVGCRQQVFQDDTLARKLFNIQLESRYSQDFRFMSVVGDAVTCLSGRTALYRHSVLALIVDDMEQETFLREPCIGGDDKCLTRLMQERGWKSRFLDTVTVYTVGSRSVATLLKQQTRWFRNTWRSDMRSVGSGWIWRREPVLAFYMLDRFVDTLFALLSPIYFSASLLAGNAVGGMILVVWWLLSRGVKIGGSLRRHPGYFLLLPAYIGYQHCVTVAKLYAFFSMNVQGWATRGRRNSPAAGDRWMLSWIGRLLAAVATSLVLAVVFLYVYEHAV